MTRTSSGQSRYVAAEWDAIYGTNPTFAGTQTNGIIYCHGSGETAATVYADTTAQRLIIDQLANNATVIAADLGGQTFGNDTAITRIGQAITYLRSTWAQSGPVVLVAGSMGVLGALSYTLAHPTEVQAVAGIIPGLDLADLMLRGAAADINAAYGGAYNDATHGPTHSPVQFADELPADLPIRLWTSNNDAIAVPATADTFVTARPQTVRTDLGALGHTSAAVIASAAGVVEWVEQFTN